MQNPVACPGIFFFHKIIKEAATGNRTFIGFFTHLQSKAFPLQYPSINALVLVSNVGTKGTVTGLLVDSDLGDVISNCTFIIEDFAPGIPTSEKTVVPVYLVFQNVIFKNPGDYHLEVLTNGISSAKQSLQLIRG